MTASRGAGPESNPMRQPRVTVRYGSPILQPYKVPP
ncbi:hypothetical protein DM75_3813 [Burkholderia mallei]|nr:hypothetical protein DM75_3813 [Burkholderia mallei]